MDVGYASLSVDLFTSTLLYKELTKVVDAEKLIKPDNLHMTLMYDKSGKKLNGRIPNKLYTADVKDVQILGTPGDKYYACVLILESDSIQERFQELLKEGFEHSFETLLPHVSLCYGKNTDAVYEAVKPLLNNGLPSFLNLCKETWELVK